MFHELRAMLDQVAAEYADIRYERKCETVLSYDGRDLSRAGSNSTDGYVLRVLKDGGLASVVFTRGSEFKTAARKALENARLIGKSRDDPMRLAKVDVVKDSYKPALNEDPRLISMSEKADLIRRYVEIPLRHEKIATLNLSYEELIREKHLVTSEGSEINEDLVTTRLAGEIISKDGLLVQNLRVAGGGSRGFADVRNLEDYFEQRSGIAIDLLGAEPIQGGVYHCILNPGMCSVFAHEAFGHYSEADLVENLPTMREKMRLGSKLGNEILSIADDPTRRELLGSYMYDDEGVMARRTQLMKNGVLVGRLHSRRTAAEFGEPVSGHGIAEDYRFPPVVRMGSIFVEPGEDDFEQLLGKLDDGFYLLDAKGGSTTGETFTFGAQYGYKVKDGKIDGMIRDINISGNLYQTMRDISAVGKDLSFRKAGGCGKGPIVQINLRSCSGGPHILVRDLVIGGL